MNTTNEHTNHSENCHEFYISLIDNSPLDTELVKALEDKGCIVHHCDSLESVPKTFERHSDFIILDPLSFPEFDFKPFLHSNESTPVILWSDLSNLDERDSYFKSGIIDILCKKEPLKETCSTLSQLFKILTDNHAFHVTLISNDNAFRDQFESLIRHRRYRRCYINDFEILKQKWTEHEHELSDLIVMDLRNLEFLDDGIELARFLRKERLSETPLVIILGQQEPNLNSKLYRNGVNDILIYPCHTDEIINAFTHHLDFKISTKLLNYEKHLSSQLKAMIDSSSIVSKADPKGIITYVNNQFCGISGYSQEELIGKPHNIIRHPDNSPLLFKQMWSILQSKQTFHGMMMNKRKDGSPYYVDTTIAPILNDDDEIIEYISIRNDITPLIEKQHEIEDKRKKIQNVLDAQTSLVCMVDKTKGIRSANKSFLEFLGFHSLEEAKQNFEYLHDLFLDIDGSIQIQHGEKYIWLDQLYELKGKFNKIAMKDRFYNHHIFAIHVAKIPDPTYSDGICYLVSFENVTELNRALREAREASEAENRFLATMSHEIRTPLNGILGFTELIHDTSLTDDQKRYLDAIQYSGETLRQIINDILEVMKFSREVPVFENQPVRLINELEAMIYPFYEQAKKKGVKLLAFIDPSLPVMVHTDLLRLKQIVINLVGNAIKFTPSGKNVHIRIKNIHEKDGTTQVSITVADEGIGIKPEQKALIFNPFTQADSSIAREFGGTGLGLNIVLRVIEGFGGKISLKSIHGTGTVFNVKLTFESDNEHYPYQCRQGKTYLYLPTYKTSSAFTLVERYLKKFECCDHAILRTSQIHSIQDQENQAICLFCDLMSLAEISSITKHFEKTSIYVFPSEEIGPHLTPIVQHNVFWVFEPLSWTNLTRHMHIYDEPVHEAQKEKEDIMFDDLTVLVAEDNEVNRFYIEEVLKKLSIQYDIARDGYAAVKKFINGKFDLVLMDINMPNLDGITATRQILRYEEEIGASHTPIIGLSADAVEKNITSYIQNGLDGYLIKPMRKSDLVNLLKDLFGHHFNQYDVTPDAMPEELNVGNDVTIASTARKLELPTDIVIKLYEKYILNAQNLIEQLSHPESPEALKASIHSLKGISKNLFIEPLGEECEKLEADLPQLNDIEQVSRCMELCDQARDVIDIMNQELQNE